MYRYKGIPIHIEDGPGLYYLIRVCPEQGAERYELRSEPGRTNMGGKIRYEGWLGTTNGVARYAEGAVHLYIKDGKPRIKAIPIEDIIESEEIGE
jgi:hypothetical protein